MKLPACLSIVALLFSSVESTELNNQGELELTQATTDNRDSISVRSLQSLNRRNFNCKVSTDVKCFLLGDGRKCEDLEPVRKDLCGELDVKMEYKYCNLQSETVILRKTHTEISFYDDFSLTMDERDMAPNECRTFYKTLQLNTCQRNWFIASLKLEGWKGYNGNPLNYCYSYFHYYKPIEKYDSPVTSAPTSKPTSKNIPIIRDFDFSFQCLCYLETTIGSGHYTVPCEDISLQYFTASFAPYQVGIVELPDYKRNTKVICEADNLSDEDADVLSAKFKIENTGELFNLDSYITTDSPVLTTTQPLFFSKVFLVDYAKFSGQMIELIPDALSIGQLSKQLVSRYDREVIPVP